MEGSSGRYGSNACVKVRANSRMLLEIGGPTLRLPSGFSSRGPFARGECAKGPAFAANFRRKTIKNWCEIGALAAQMPARLTKPCRHRGAAGKPTTEACRFLPGKHLIAISAQTSQSEDSYGRALGRMFVRGLEHGAAAPRA